MGEHAVFTGLMALMLLGAFLTISLVMFWAPSVPFPQMKAQKRQLPEAEEETDQD